MPLYAGHYIQVQLKISRLRWTQQCMPTYNMLLTFCQLNIGYTQAQLLNYLKLPLLCSPSRRALLPQSGRAYYYLRNVKLPLSCT